jgi:hypothetical protein
MIDELSSLPTDTQDTTEVTVEKTFDVQGASPEVPTGSEQQVAQTPTAQEIADWTKDDRYTRMWKKDPNQLYKSYKSADDLIEKQYKPLRSQADSFTKLFKDYGYEPDVEQLKGAFDKLKSWEDPENPVVKRGNYVSYFLDHPEYGNELTSVLEGYRKREVRKQYGVELPDEVINEIVENRKFREETIAKEKKQAQEMQTKQLLGTINEGWDKVVSESKKIGFPVTDDIRTQLLDICAKEQVEPRFMFYKFQEMYNEEIQKHQRASIQSELVKNRQRTQKTGVIPASSTKSRVPNAPTDGTKPGMIARVLDRVGLK